MSRRTLVGMLLCAWMLVSWRLAELQADPAIGKAVRIAPAKRGIAAQETDRGDLSGDAKDTDVAPPAIDAEQLPAANEGMSTDGLPDEVLSPQMLALQAKLRTVLAHYHRRQLNTRDHTPWEVMHSIVAYGVQSELRRGGPDGAAVNAIGWLCFDGSCRGLQMLYLENGQVAARKGPFVQGHHGQLLAILAQAHLSAEYPLRVRGKDFTVADLIRNEQQSCQAGTELTFKLIGLMHYLDSDATWKNFSGQEWSIPRLIQEEIKQPIHGAPCGGTHRLMGLSYAVNKRLQRNQPIDGEYLRAKTYVDQYHRYTLGMQNADGSFSTEWFKRSGARPDLERRVQTTGHILEWLVFSLSEEELRDPRVIKAVDYLASVLLKDRERGWDIGPLGHATHALAIYQRRVFGEPAVALVPEVAAGLQPVLTSSH